MVAQNIMDEEVDFIPRDYQVKLLDQAVQKNTILYLPTGSGKTFVAIMLLKHLSNKIERPFSEGGQRSFFMVNTVALVSQQAASIKRHTPFDVGEYSGDMNVDFWDIGKWHEELENHHILVMTCQIFLNMLMHGYIRLSNCNVLIFDECHHAVNEHPMRLVMKQFEHCPIAQQPRVLGLTATLINRSCKVTQVMEEVKSLERTFHSQIATVDHRSIVQKFSTKPKERVLTYQPPTSSEFFTLIYSEIDDIQKEICRMDFDAMDNVLPVIAPMGSRHMYDKQKTKKLIKNLFEDLRIHVEMFGLYGGVKACLAHLIQLERRKCRADKKVVHGFLDTLISKLRLIHRIMITHIGTDTNGCDKMYQYSTSKLRTLFEIIKDYSAQSPKESFCCVVFVQRRFTAKILYHVLKDLQSADPDFAFVRPDFIVGFNMNPTNDTREGRLERKRNFEVLKKFNHKDHITNLMVSSDVLEEGIDIPSLSLVVKFDFPKNHTSYIQSKGRARHEDSNYVLMVSEDEKEKCMTKYHTYCAVEETLQKLLIGQNDYRRAPLLAAIEQDLYEEEVPPYFTGGEGGPSVTMASAVQLLNRYCSMLPQDKFTTLTPDWFLNKDNSVSVQLPINSPLRGIVKGLPLVNLRSCKRSAALETCKRLHQIRELDDNLLPRGRVTELIADSTLFPLWMDETWTEGCPKPGTKKMRRAYNKKFPESLSNCRVMPGSLGYLHKIVLTPVYPRPTINRRIVFFDLLLMDQGFAILSAKPMPQICDFTIFLNVGGIKVHIDVNHEQVSLNANELKELQDFNTMLFNDVLRLEKTFVVVDNANEENSYTVVPMTLNGIDWFTVREQKLVQTIQKPSEEARGQVHVSEVEYLHTVIAPWYRTVLPDQHYIVTRVCPDMSPESPFPTHDFQTYNRYFIEKYQTHILNKAQPLVEVKAISNRMHCIKPRTTPETKAQSKRKRQQMNDDFEEHLVPELCIKYTFPAVLWLKATCLPTVLHRLVNLLLAEELRQRINSELGIGVVNLANGMSWLPLVVDESCHTKDENEAELLGIVNEVTVPTHVSRTSDPYWADDREPLDIDRCKLEDVRLLEIQYYESFISKSLPSAPIEKPVQIKDTPVKKIALLDVRPEGLGPQQYEILQALTASTANDIINLERLETLGDSFLKFAVSQFLFQQHIIDEGKLTCIKGKLLGNRNLFYCARHKKLGEIMKIYDFDPKADWLPPRMCVPRFLQKLLCKEDLKLSPNILIKLNVSPEERKSGVLDHSTMEALVQEVCDAPEEAQFVTTMEAFLNRLTINDKTVADAVEALIGAYLKATGVRGALLLLGWLQVLPADKATPEYMFDLPPPSALIVPNGDVNHHLRACTTIEERLGYTFKDRSFLLQALTHPSYVPNRITDNYQRLEFLGDALLDFLITCHIFESCGILSPGQLTDLRSSLVNNITFASLVVRNGFHKFMLAQSPKLLDMIDRFVRLQEEQNYAINETVLFMIEEDDTEVAEAIDVPKVLGDLFESLAGAIYLDSNMSLATVWEVFYRLMHKEIEEFSKNVPKQPIRLLHEYLGQNRPEFKKTEFCEDKGCIKVDVEIIVRGEKRIFTGYGDNKNLAKMAASKLAMRDLGNKL